ncbi:hypothetical protein SDC9_90961 [bioreactor metagenome]|uniref:NAD-specific glutamate dehydrogenase n=1 Tax=bioreactor metagenome TaxID=1076179 RepID=A0A645A0B3_9ZZZZ
MRACPVGGVGLLRLAVVQEHALLAGHAGELARQLQQPAGQACGEGVFARAHDADDGNAARARAFIGGGEQVLDNGLTHRARRAAGGLEVHEQAGAGVHFQDRALASHGLGDVLQDHVHAGDVEADDLGGQRGVIGHVGVHFVGAVDGHVAVALQQNRFALGGHGVGGDVLALELQLDGRGFQVDPVQRVFLLGATARVLVDHGHQLGQRGRAVARHAHGLATAGSHHLATHHENAVLGAVDEFFDDHVRAFGLGQCEGGLDVILAAQVQRHAACVVAVGGLDGDGKADVLRHGPCFFGIGRDLAFGHGHAAGGEQALGEVLVLRDAFGDGAGLVALGGPDAALRGAIAQLHQIAVVQADVRNTTLAGGIHDAAGAGAKIAVVDFGLDGLNGGL